MADRGASAEHRRHSREGFVLELHEAPRLGDIQRTLAAEGNEFIATPFQRARFLEAFCRHVPRNCTPFIVTVRERSSSRLAMVLPLLKRQAAALSYIEATDLGLSDYFAPKVAAWFSPTPHQMADIWAQLRKVLPQADILSLKKLPGELQPGRANPLVLLPDTVDMGTATKTLELDDVDHPQHYKRSGLYKDGMRNLRKLGTLGDVEFRVAESEAQALDLFEQLVAQRRRRFVALEREDPFMDESVQAFYRDVITNGAPKGEVLFGGLFLNGECIATDMGLVDGDTHHGLITTMNGDELRRYSPGTIAFMLILDETMARGIRYYDIGVGEFAYKQRLSGTEMRLYERHEPLSLRGRVALADATARRLVRHGIARYPQLRGPAEAVRSRLRKMRKWVPATAAPLPDWERLQVAFHAIGVA
ncbi:GNAT family N-acetyltransferase [Mesorhizobium sp. CAU 1741]|uniref:GNAT family N-acetyltransferase n=1 Tax=Mesorhizobium sp. CAU 1741 TaxID=3140366 RepID=UPI00325AD786